MAIFTQSSVDTTASSYAKRTDFAAANVKSSYVELITATTSYANRLALRSFEDSGSARQLVDIAFGASGSEVVVFSNYFRAATNATEDILDIPIEIPIGTRIAFRTASHQANKYCYASVVVSHDPRFDKGASPTAYAAYKVDTATTDVDASAMLTCTVANTMGAEVQIVASVPANATHVVLSGSQSGTSPIAQSLSEIRVSSDAGASYTTLFKGIGIFYNYQSRTVVLPIESLAGQIIAMRLQSANTTMTKKFAMHIGTGAVIGSNATTIREDGSMQDIIRGSAVDAQRTLYFDLYAEDGVTPWAGSNTGKKAEWQFNGSGTVVTSTNDIVRCRAGSPQHRVLMTIAESNVGAIDDDIIGGVPASTGNHGAGNFRAKVFEAAFTAAAGTVSANVVKINGVTVLGAGTSANKWRA